MRSSAAKARRRHDSLCGVVRVGVVDWTSVSEKARRWREGGVCEVLAAGPALDLAWELEVDAAVRSSIGRGAECLSKWA